MKLGPLKTAIRQHGGAVSIFSSYLNGWTAVQKGSFIEVLDARFPKNSDETGLKLDSDGRIQIDGELQPMQKPLELDV